MERMLHIPMERMLHIPMDIIHDLFLRLSASTLVRFRVVSKPWSSLIDSPDFIDSHLNRTLETGDHLMILLRAPRSLRTVYLDAPDKVSEIEHPLQAGGFTVVFGSCNGVIGLANSSLDIALFNPSTRNIERLPIEPVDFPETSIFRENFYFGLGYDSESKDYKVVRMIQRKCKGDKLVKNEIKVFSLKRESWRRVELRSEFQYLLNLFYGVQYRRWNGVVAGNSLHWILPRTYLVIAMNTIIRFDLASEEFETLGFPEDLYDEDNLDLGVLDGCLCAMAYNNAMNYSVLTNVDVWIQREYKDEGSWIKLFKVTKPESVESMNFMRPMIYSKDRSKILLEINLGKLVWYDLESKSFEELRIQDCEGSCSAEILVSSLELGCKGDPHRARENKMMNKSNKRDDFLSEGFNLKL